MTRPPVNLDDAYDRFDDLWSPRIVARVNDMDIKVVKVEGDFVAHVHNDTDELFLVHRGRLRIEFDEGAVVLGPGDLYVVPAGVRHRPVADEPCEIVLLEPAGTANQGELGGTFGRSLE